MKIIENTVTLRPVEMSDKADLARLANNIKIWNNVRDEFPHPYTEKDAESFINLCKTAKNAAKFAIIWNGQFVGMIGLIFSQALNYSKSAELGYWIGEPFWGKGIGTKALSEIVKYGFEELELKRIFANVLEYNKASMKMLEKCGFEFEGIGKSASLKSNHFYDEYRFAKVK
jgi:[ribosomal protein S5]-alanine N-acetyltransferase